MIIRVAVPDDAESIAAIHVRSWQQAYFGQLPQDFLDSLNPVDRVARWRDSLEQQDPPRRATVVVAEEELLGFADICPTRDDDAGPSSIAEVTSIYLRPDAWGRGLGRGLMTEALRLLRDADYVAATLWVLQSNVRAIDFYEANGWATDGATKLATIAEAPITEVRYRIPLS